MRSPILKALCFTLTFLGGTSAGSEDDLPPMHQRFTKPKRVREWQQFCRKSDDFNPLFGVDALNTYLVSMGKEGWELVLMDAQFGMVCFKRPAS
ncbi:hypothetical protein [Corallococcus caeni]|uniref:Uncharacterized protein n=1 Tax=Corallococcus caeni TaxID=3082388 RepID=A0ABQ6QR23_9BACT|nr:hypothetical protein ASNO1_27260 [Corallococcus sp. NO1]